MAEKRPQALHQCVMGLIQEDEELLSQVDAENVVLLIPGSMLMKERGGACGGHDSENIMGKVGGDLEGRVGFAA